MNKLKKISYVLVILVLVFNMTALFGCSNSRYNTALPTLKAEDGWVQTLKTDFSKYNSMQELYDESIWTYSTHGLRNYEYWCDQQLSMDKTENVFKVTSTYDDNHVCDVCKQQKGIFTGGIETIKRGTNEGFYQTFGYYETVVKVPDAPGMWSAFWLQSETIRKVGNKGIDGTEIDIYESSFHGKNRTKSGNALHYDGYGKLWHKCIDHVTDVGYDLYDYNLDVGYGKGYHKFALHWNPECYVFYVDDKPVWATNGGGVCRTPDYLRLTVEIRDTKYGPYGQKLGTFESRTDGSTDFKVKSVNVWQNENYVPYIMSNDEFVDESQKYEAVFAVLVTLGVLAVIVFSIVLSKLIKKRKASKAK